MTEPTTRSRTGLFLSYRDSRASSSTRFSSSRTTYNDDDDEEQQLIQPHRVVDMDLPPEWYFNFPAQPAPLHVCLG